MRTGRLIVVAGPPGAGKTTVSKLLVESSNNAVRIEGDAYFSCFPTQQHIESNEKMRLMMKAMFTSALPFLEESYDVYLDFVVPPWFINTAKKIVSDTPLFYFIIRPTQKVCSFRAASREFAKIENYESCLNLFNSFGDMPGNTIEGDNIDPTALATTIRDHINESRFLIEAIQVPMVVTSLLSPITNIIEDSSGSEET